MIKMDYKASSVYSTESSSSFYLKVANNLTNSSSSLLLYKASKNKI